LTRAAGVAALPVPAVAAAPGPGDAELPATTVGGAFGAAGVTMEPPEAVLTEGASMPASVSCGGSPA
jgi:hypothetical protein